MENLSLVVILIDIVVVAIASFLGAKYLTNRMGVEQRQKTELIIQEAKEKARSVELEARDNAIKIKQEAEGELSRRRSELSHEEDRLQNRRTDLDQRFERLDQREQNINKRQSVIDKRANDLEKIYQEQVEQLQQVSHMTVEEARQSLLAAAEKEARSDMARIIRQIEGEARSEGEKRARELVTEAIQRVASDQVTQVTTSTVLLPNEEMKGRIVGRNGRNIRAFEQAAGVDVIVDDTPEAVTVSCFDSTRREIARRALQRLIQDGRIHPAHIEKVLAEEEKEVEKEIRSPQISVRVWQLHLPGISGVGCQSRSGQGSATGRMV